MIRVIVAAVLLLAAAGTGWAQDDPRIARDRETIAKVKECNDKFLPQKAELDAKFDTVTDRVEFRELSDEVLRLTQQLRQCIGLAH